MIFFYKINLHTGYTQSLNMNKQQHHQKKSHFTCCLSSTAISADPPSVNVPTMHSSLVCQKPEPQNQIIFQNPFFLFSKTKRASQFYHFSDIPFDQKYPVHAVLGPIGGDTHTEDRRTLRLIDCICLRANSVKRNRIFLVIVLNKILQ